jgi:hypothetical protein
MPGFKEKWTLPRPSLRLNKDDGKYIAHGIDMDISKTNLMERCGTV